MKHQQIALQRNSSCNKSTRNINSSNYYYYSISPSPSVIEHEDQYLSNKLLLQRQTSASLSSFNFTMQSQRQQALNKINSIFFSFFRLLGVFSLANLTLPTCKWITFPSSYLSLTQVLGRRKVTGTLFGFRRGHVSFAIQNDPGSDPVLVMELAMTTSMLMKEMCSELVRIALECEKTHSLVQPGSNRIQTGLYGEPGWSMYCNGKKCGYAVARTCTGLDLHVLGTVKTVSVGAGVIPMMEDSQKAPSRSEGELLFMRARFERVIESRDSEAFYMMNPGGQGGSELSIFLLRI